MHRVYPPRASLLPHTSLHCFSKYWWDLFTWRSIMQMEEEKTYSQCTCISGHLKRSADESLFNFHQNVPRNRHAKPCSKNASGFTLRWSISCALDLSIYLCMCIFIFLSLHLSIYQSIYLFLYLSNYLYIYIPIYIAIYIFIYLRWTIKGASTMPLANLFVESASRTWFRDNRKRDQPDIVF